MIRPEVLAAELHRAQRAATPVPLITERHPDLTWLDARAIALATDDIRLAAGDRCIGFKLGWTSAAMRDALGIGRPNWGTLWASQNRDGVLELGEFIHPKVEPELVWRAPTGSAGGTGEWALGLEIVDPRFPGYEFDFLDNTSDNSSSAAIVLGPFSTLPGTMDIARVEVTFGNGDEVRAGVGASAMESPTHAVSWLMRELAAEGREIAPGDIVFTGGLTAPFDLVPGVTYTLSSEALGRVQLAVD